MITNASSRLAAVNYLSRNLRLRLAEVAETVDASTALAQVVGQDAGLMVRGLAAGLDDDNVLVRRGTLDLLIGILPLGGQAVKRCAMLSYRLYMVQFLTEQCLFQQC
jgi:hypothetical protein